MQVYFTINVGRTFWDIRGWLYGQDDQEKEFLFTSYATLLSGIHTRQSN